MARVVIYFGSIAPAAPVVPAPVTWHPFQSDTGAPVIAVAPSGFIPPVNPQV